MSTTSENLHLDPARVNPAGTFGDPRRIVEHPDLSHRMKLALLEQWEREARALAVAEEEGMTGGEESMLSRVRRAIQLLAADHETRPRGPATKHGG